MNFMTLNYCIIIIYSKIYIKFETESWKWKGDNKIKMIGFRLSFHFEQYYLLSHATLFICTIFQNPMRLLNAKCKRAFVVVVSALAVDSQGICINIWMWNEKTLLRYEKLCRMLIGWQARDEVAKNLHILCMHLDGPTTTIENSNLQGASFQHSTF